MIRRKLFGKHGVPMDFGTLLGAPKDMIRKREHTKVGHILTTSSVMV